MRYIGRITDTVRIIIDGLFPSDGDLAYDMTLGNGKDTDYLSGRFEKVIALDIQESAVRSYKAPSNVIVHLADHGDLSGFHEAADLILYNLGYLPGGDLSITTKAETTVRSLKQSVRLLKKMGVLIVVTYTGHDDGEEERAVREFLMELDGTEFSVMENSYLGRKNSPPVMYMVQRK